MSSWADQVELEDDLPPPGAKYDGDMKIVTEYNTNEEGKKVKIVRYYKVEKRKVSKPIAKRKTWKKYGNAEFDPPGPNPANTISSTEEIFMQFVTKNDVENKEDDVLSKLKGVKMVKCRLCKEDHWTTHCPYKDKLSALPDMQTPAATANKTDEKPKTDKYIPPSMRAGAANRQGESMTNSRNRDDFHTVRVTNLSDEVTDQDLQDLFRPIGQIARVFLGMNRHTGLPKGFAFVSFYKREDAMRAIQQINGFGYANLILGVDWSNRPGNAPN